MTLAQIFDWCQKKSYFSRDDDEIWQAINSAAHLLYKEAVLENRGYFIVWDTTSLTIQPNVEEYALPATVEQMVRLRERLLASDPYRLINPADINDAVTTESQFISFDDSALDSELSQFVYNGPYAKQSDALAQTYLKSIRLEPIPTDTRFTELVYTAKFIEITGQESPLVIDPEGHDALKFLAAAELLMTNDDDNAENFAATGDRHKTQYLKLVRKRQIQLGPQIEPYITDMD
jgi:hypothetical protein